MERMHPFRPKGGPHLTHTWFGTGWDQPGATLVGRSAGLPFAIAAISGWQSLAPGWHICELDRRTAATGVMDRYRVTPVEASTLKPKARACFFSNVETLWVPGQQKEMFKKEVASLSERYPKRQLEIRGVDDLRDILGPAREVEYGEVLARRSRGLLEGARTITAWFTYSRSRMVTSVISTILLIALWIFILLSTQNKPDSAVWEGNDIVVRNSHGWITMKLKLPSPPLHQDYGLEHWHSKSNVWDLDGDGLNEIMVLHGSGVNRTDLITIFDRKGNRIWQASSRDLDLEGGVIREDMNWWRIYGPVQIGEMTKGILALRRSMRQSFSLLDIIDSSNGKLIAQFENAGHMDAIHRIDLNSDGVNEYAIVGTNNPTGRGLYLVLSEENFGNLDKMKSHVSADVTEAQSMMDPECLQKGILTALSFAKTSFDSAERTHCRVAFMEDHACANISCSGVDGSDRILFSFDFSELKSPKLKWVHFSDAGRAAIREKYNPDITLEEIQAEELRLAEEVMILTPNGWVGIEEYSGK
ncbi:MAG: hypothetical protein KJ927_18765 [Candidatus Eisenbacteria bacterium]|nr:hypothetical protein [Candidatus Eisenbacteria bacterium]